MKFFLISLVVLVVMFVLTKGFLNSMDIGETLIAELKQHYPKRVKVCSCLTVLSFFETVIALIIWIVSM